MKKNIFLSIVCFRFGNVQYMQTVRIVYKFSDPRQIKIAHYVFARHVQEDLCCFKVWNRP